MKINYMGKCLLIETDGKKILVIGDLHLGYGESLRESGVFMPGDLYKEVIDELGLILQYINNNYDKKSEDILKMSEKNYNGIRNISKKNIMKSKSAHRDVDNNKFRNIDNDINGLNNSKIIDEVVLLGDLKHEFGRIMKSEWQEVISFIGYLSSRCGKIVIVKGNHDVFTESITRKKGIEIKDYYIINDIAFVHGDRELEDSEIYDSNIKYWIMGHGHPAVRISDGMKEEKYKCFLTGKYKGKEIIIVPSFFSVNEGTDARDFELGLAWDFELMKFNVKVIGETTENLEVLDFGKFRKLGRAR